MVEEIVDTIIVRCSFAGCFTRLLLESRGRKKYPTRHNGGEIVDNIMDVFVASSAFLDTWWRRSLTPSFVSWHLSLQFACMEALWHSADLKALSSTSGSVDDSTPVEVSNLCSTHAKHVRPRDSVLRCCVRKK
eukprot:6345254-Amphidinium_carterae.2